VNIYKEKEMQKQRLLSRFTIWFLSVLLILSLLLAVLPQSAQALAIDVTCKKNYVVKPGESIYRIAREKEVSVYKLAKANNLESPYRVTAGMTLCIPEEPKPSSNFSWTAYYSGDKITINGTNFKKQHPFFVKVRENDTSIWYKLGLTTSDRTGDMSTKQDVPKSLLKKSMLTVCLKDGVTDYLVCKTVFKQ
jgi:LysM repeat protein